jgi:hypothetical protein
MRTIRLQASGFRDEAGKEHLLDVLQITAVGQALVWQGVLDGNTLNPFIKDLPMGEEVSIVAIEAQKEICTFNTLFIRCNLQNMISVHKVDVRLEFRNS